MSLDLDAAPDRNAEAVTAPLGAVIYEDSGGADAFLAHIAEILAEQGVKLAGVVQANDPHTDGGRCDMSLIELSSGAEIRLSQNLGAAARGCSLDPAGLVHAGALIEGGSPRVLDWIQRMLWPKAEGAFESWARVAPTLMPILTKQVGRLFWPWTLANEKALAEGAEEFSVQLGNDVWTQKPQKYHARSLAMVRAKYAAVTDKKDLDMILAAAGCLAGMRA